jgi:hypothetical protein
MAAQEESNQKRKQLVDFTEFSEVAFSDESYLSRTGTMMGLRAELQVLY